MIDKHTIEQVLDRTNIVEVIGDYVELKRKGSRFFACCPFHQENTPSFAVFDNTGTYKCFGCGKGGNAVTFLMEHEAMTYPEAIKSLARRCHIDIVEREPSAQEEQEYRIKEAMWAANKRLMDIYKEELQNCPGAKAYAYKRWGEDYCLLRDIGYCPDNAKLVDKAKISDEIIEKLHLKNKGGFDFFSGRIIIPIKDRQQRVIGFTARDFEGNSKAKYMNSTESPIYIKSESIFGIDSAWREAAMTKTMFLVEGAPDCMRLQSIGILNTVAPLGTAWTDSQFDIIRRVADRVCFIPDADPPKDDEEYGPGIKAVMKSGEKAMTKGLSVAVREIPISSTKQDPDSYCTSKAKFRQLEEKDFVLWIAEKLFVGDMTTEQKGKVVNHIASILMHVKDETTLTMYVSQLKQFDGSKQLWMKAVERQRNLAEMEAAKAKAEKEAGLFDKYGFNENKTHNYYYSVSENGGLYVWSNFIMIPRFHIKDTINSKRIFMLKNEKKQEALVEMKQEDLVSLQKFMVRVESLGNFIWKASQRELNKLKSYLYEQTETAENITQMGWNRNGFYAFGNGVYYEGEFIKADDNGIVRLPKGNFYLPACSVIYRDEIKLFQFERRFVHLALSTISMREYTSQIFRVFGNNGRVGFMFLIATLFRDIVTRETRSFPILNLFGPKGSGKSELGHTLMSFFISNNVPPNMQNSTLPALNDAVAAVANGLVHLDEYKNNLDIIKIEFLKGLWDGTGRTRMNIDMDKKLETTSVDSGVILSGQEMPTADNALFSRLIFLQFSKSVFTETEKANYRTLKVMRSQGMTHLTLQLLSYRKVMESQFTDYFRMTTNDVMDKLDNMAIEDRILTNWIVPLAAYRTLANIIDVDMNYKEMVDISVEGIKYQNAQCSQNNELAAFWNMVVYLVNEGEMNEGGDYRIEYVRRLKTDMVKAIWEETKPVLYLQKSRLFMLYKKHAKMVGDATLPEASLKYYLKNSRAYLGEKKGVRFKVFKHGIPQTYIKDNIRRELSSVQRSYCFDYETLERDYKINLLQTDDTDDTAHIEDYEAEHPKQLDIPY